MTISKIKKLFQNKFLNPYILAEAGVNHECSTSNAIKMIDLASQGGASGINFNITKLKKLHQLIPQHIGIQKKKK